MNLNTDLRVVAKNESNGRIRGDEKKECTKFSAHGNFSIHHLHVISNPPESMVSLWAYYLVHQIKAEG